MAEMLDSEKKYIEAYEQRMEGFQTLAIDTDDEGCFSWTSCDVCDQKKGGDRYRATMCNPGPDNVDEKIEVSVCTDCVMFAANGELPTVWP